MTFTPEELQQLATKAKRLKSGDDEREAHPLSELIEADKHIANQGARNKTSLPIRFQKTRPPGAV